MSIHAIKKKWKLDKQTQINKKQRMKKKPTLAYENIVQSPKFI